VQDPPRRADAQRNAARLVRAALDAFEEAGAAVPLDEVAARAGVGIATLYRLFGGRDGLVSAAFATFFEEEVEPVLHAARDTLDPWVALTRALSATVEALAGHKEMLTLAHDCGAVSVDIAERFLGPLGEILDAAQRAGAVRDDLVVRDLAAVVVMALATTKHKTIKSEKASTADRRRYMALLLAGLRPSAETVAAALVPRGHAARAHQRREQQAASSAPAALTSTSSIELCRPKSSRY
jgi:AcrR family transcriptional regulator